MNIVSCDKITEQNISCIIQQMFMYMEKILTHDFILWWSFLFYANRLLDFSWLSTESFCDLALVDLNLKHTDKEQTV